jgi:hypothetical protein
MSENTPGAPGRVASVSVQTPTPNATLGTSFLARGGFSSAKRETYTVSCVLIASNNTQYNPVWTYLDGTSFDWLALFTNAPAGSNYILQAALYASGGTTPLDTAIVAGLTLDATKLVTIGSPANGATLGTTFGGSGGCPSGLTAAGRLFSGNTLVQSGTNNTNNGIWTSDFSNVPAGTAYVFIAEALNNILSVAAAQTTNITVKSQ